MCKTKSFFVGLIEGWRERTGLEKMTAIEHLLGAYFSAVYTLQYQECVQRLILLSPAGVMHNLNNTVPLRETDDWRGWAQGCGQLAAGGAGAGTVCREQGGEFWMHVTHAFVGGGLERLPFGVFKPFLGSHACGQDVSPSSCVTSPLVTNPAENAYCKVELCQRRSNNSITF